MSDMQIAKQKRNVYVFVYISPIIKPLGSLRWFISFIKIMLYLMKLWNLSKVPVSDLYFLAPTLYVTQQTHLTYPEDGNGHVKW